MRPELWVWASLALGLIAAEALLPGVLLLWLGLAAVGVWFLVLTLPGLSLFEQVLAWVVCSFLSVALYWRWFRQSGLPATPSTLNQPAQHLLQRILLLSSPILHGAGRLQIDDTWWDIKGPDLPAGAAVRITAYWDGVLMVEDASTSKE